MAQFKKTYPLSKSTLTINYPDNLIDVDDDPKKYFTRDSWDQSGFGNSMYPDVMVFPRKGSFINSKMTFKRSVKVYMNDNGTETLLSSEPETTEQVIEPFGGEEMLWQSDSRQKKQICACILCFTPISVLNHNEWQLQQDKNDGGGWYLRHQYNITINITGKPKYFTSNALRYFCYGQSETDKNGKAVFGTVYGTGDMGKMVGWILVKNANDRKENPIDIKLVRLGRKKQMKCANQTYQYNKMETRSLGTSGQNRLIPRSTVNFSDDPVNEFKNIKCDGFFYEMGLVNTLPTGKGTYNIKGKYVGFNNDQIFAVQMYPPGKRTGYIEFQGVYDDSSDKAGLPKFSVKNTNDTFYLPVDFPCICYYWKKGERIFHIRSNQFMAMKEKTKITTKNGLEFSGYFATNSFLMNGFPDFYPFIIKWESPFLEWGMNLFHLFISPCVYYLKLNCTQAADPRYVLKNQETDFNRMTEMALANFGSLAIKKNIDSYPNGDRTVNDELKKLKDSRCKFKILYVNCHGGKFSDTDASYGALDDPSNGRPVLFTYANLKYLLKGRTRSDEYYFVHFSSCFGGGFCEDHVHNNTSQSNYTVTTAASELGDRLLIWFNDCANSPAWVGPRILGDLFNLIPQGDPGAGDTYSNQAATINQLVTQGRRKNIQLLVDFMKKYYSFLQQMLDTSKLQWNQSRYNESIRYAENLIVLASRADDDGVELAYKYPIVFLSLKVLDAICTMGGRSISTIPIKQNITFTEFTVDSKYMLPIINKFMDANRTLVRQNEYMYLTPNMYNMIRSNPMKQKLKRYFVFFKDLYQLCCKLDANTVRIQKMNKSYNINGQGEENRGAYSHAWLLDDVPGIIDRCGSSYGGKKWPFCPGIENMTSMNEFSPAMKSVIFGR